MVESYLIEHCDNCKKSQSRQFIGEEEAGDDCNVRQAVKNYKEEQRGANPHKCHCGTKLTALVG